MGGIAGFSPATSSVGLFLESEAKKIAARRWLTDQAPGPIASVALPMDSVPVGIGIGVGVWGTTTPARGFVLSLCLLLFLCNFRLPWWLRR